MKKVKQMTWGFVDTFNDFCYCTFLNQYHPCTILNEPTSMTKCISVWLPIFCEKASYCFNPVSGIS